MSRGKDLSAGGVILLVLLGVGVGGAAALDGMRALAVGGALLVGWLMFTRPFLGLCLIVVTLPLENAASFGQGLTATRLIGVAAAGCWLAGKTYQRESYDRLLRNPVTWLALSFAFLVLVSGLWATDERVVRNGFIQLVQLLVLCAIGIDVIEDWDHAQVLVRVLIASGLLAAGITLWEAGQVGLRRAGGISAGINGTAELLVTLTPFAFYLIISERTTLYRLLGAAYLGIAPVAVLATLSRFSIMLLPVVLGIMALQTLRARRGVGWLLVGLGALTFAVLSQEDSYEKIQDRVESIAPYLMNTVQADTDGLSERGYHLAVGLQMFKDNPVYGVGYNNFGYYFLYEYQYTVPGGNNLWQSRRSPHSSFIGILAELGLIGAAIWSLLLIVGASAAWRAGRIPVIREDRILRALCFASFVAFGLQAGPYGFYSPSQKSKILWILLSLCVVLWRLARDADDLEWEDAQWESDPDELMEDGTPLLMPAYHRS